MQHQRWWRAGERCVGKGSTWLVIYDSRLAHKLRVAVVGTSVAHDQYSCSTHEPTRHKQVVGALCHLTVGLFSTKFWFRFENKLFCATPVPLNAYF